MNKFTIEPNNFLNQSIQTFNHTDYLGYRKTGNPDYINTLKNTYNDDTTANLNRAAQELRNVLLVDLPKISHFLNLDSLTVCVVPRAKTNYTANQLLFKSTIKYVVNEIGNFVDGTDYILRHTNTKTTHFRNPIPNYNNDGSLPYPGITINTCNISNGIRNKNILLIDDLYTKTVNIDEDAIQALLENGALSVTFYAIGKTVYNN